MQNKVLVLLVEDSFLAQRVVEFHMTNHGCKVDIASDGVIALEMAIKKQYDIILMDIGLGEGPDGFEVTAQIKQQSQLNKTTPIMAVTSHNEAEYQAKAAEFGMVGYFNKPFTEKEADVVLEIWKKLA